MARTRIAPGRLASRVLALAVLAAFLMSASSAHALVIPQGVETLARRARSVVVARVTAVVPRWSSSGEIVSDVDLAVERQVAGSGSSTARVMVPGGQIGDIGMVIDEAPRFEPGQRCLLFLDAAGRVVADRQGKLDIVGDRVPGAGQSLATVETRVRRALTPPTTDPWYGVVQELVASAPEVASVTAAGTPVISGITPSSQSAGTGSSVTIAGSGFGPTQGSVTFYQDSTTRVTGSITSWSDTSIVCLVPSKAGSGPVVVTDSDGTASVGYSYAVGFSYSGYHWHSTTMTYYVNPNCDDAVANEAAGVQTAADSWSARSPFHLVYAGLSSATVNPPAQNFTNEIYWSSAGFSAGTLAWNRYWYSSGSQIVESDIVFNDNYKWGDSSTGSDIYDIESVAIHELGHSLSLDDQYGADTAKVMYGSYGAGHMHRALSTEDAKGVAYIYGCTITSSAGSNGSISPSGARTVAYGGSQTYTITPSTGFRVADVLVDGSSAGAVTSYSFTNVTSSHSISASFAPNTFTLKYAAGANGSLSGTTSQTVSYNGSGTAVTANAATNYHFENWSDGSVANPRTDSGVTANVNVTANFAINTYTLTYSAGSGGTISGTSPQTVNYNASGTAVTAVPNTGYTFVKWSDNVMTAARTDTGVTANVNVTANFAINTYTLTYSAGSGGTISGTSPQTVNYNGSGTAVTAVPSTGYYFSSWSDGLGTAARTDANVTANKSVTANFTATPPTTYTLTYTAGTGGTISGTSPQTVNSGASGTSVTAVPASGYRFVNWSDASTANPRTDANVTANKSLTANFTRITYTLTYTAGTGGTISGTSPQTVNSGASGTAVTAVPASGYRFVNWSDASTANPRTDTNVTATKSVTANFASTTTPPTPVYRFIHLKAGVHFYTASDAEMRSVRDTLYKTYKLEGVAYTLNTANPANDTPLYRFLNLKRGVHFYTASDAEMRTVRDTLYKTYKLEGVAYKVSLSSAGGATPVYRFLNLKQGVHFYTASEDEMRTVRDTLQKSYRLEGIAFYLAP